MPDHLLQKRGFRTYRADYEVRRQKNYDEAPDYGTKICEKFDDGEKFDK